MNSPEAGAGWLAWWGFTEALPSHTPCSWPSPLNGLLSLLPRPQACPASPVGTGAPRSVGHSGPGRSEAGVLLACIQTRLGSCGKLLGAGTGDDGGLIPKIFQQKVKTSFCQAFQRCQDTLSHQLAWQEQHPCAELQLLQTVQAEKDQEASWDGDRMAELWHGEKSQPPSSW